MHTDGVCFEIEAPRFRLGYRPARMLEYFGSIQHLAVAPLIWIVLFPALGALILLAFLGRAELLRDPPSPPPPPRTLARIAAASVALGFAAAVYHAARLAQAPEGMRVFYTSLTRILRVGQLDFSLALSLDPLSASFVLVTTFVATLLLLREALGPREPSRSSWLSAPATLAAACVFVAGTSLALLADDLAVFLIGSQAAGASAFVLAGSAGRARFVVERLGEIAFLVGGAVLFWALGGSWSDAEYVPDLNPRYVAVSSLGSPEGHVTPDSTGHARRTNEDEEEEGARAAHVVGSVMGKGATPPLTGRGYLTLASTPGATIYLDDARTPWSEGAEPLRAPLVHRPLQGGVHTVRVHPGEGSDDYVMGHVPLGGEGELSLVVVGATLHFREMSDQMVLVNARAERFLRDAFLAKHLFGLSIPTLLTLLFGAGALARSGLFPLVSRADDASIAPPFVAPLLASSGGALLGAYLLARLSPVLGASSSPSVVVSAAAAAIVLFVTWAARASQRVDAQLAAASLAAIVVCLAGAPVLGATLALVFSLAAPLPHLFVDAALAASRGARVAIAAAVSIALALGVSFALVAGLDASSFPRAVPATILAAAMAFVASGLASARSAPREAEKSAKKSKKKPAPLADAWARAAFYVLAALSIVASLSLAVGTLVHDAAWLAEWLEPSFRAAELPAFSSPTAGYGVFALVLVVFAAASFAKGAPARARRAFDAAVLTNAVARGTAWLADLAVDVDRRVIGGIVEFGGVFMRAAAWAEARFDKAVIDAPSHAATERVLEAGSRPLAAASRASGERVLLASAALLPVVAVVLYLLSSR